MFSCEIDELIRSKGNRLTVEDYFVLNPLLSPQINHVHYDAFSNKYSMTTDDGYSWEFEVVKD